MNAPRPCCPHGTDSHGTRGCQAGGCGCRSGRVDVPPPPGAVEVRLAGAADEIAAVTAWLAQNAGTGWRLTGRTQAGGTDTYERVAGTLSVE